MIPLITAQPISTSWCSSLLPFPARLFPPPRADAVLAVLAQLSALRIRHVSVQSSVSLQHLPWSTDAEPEAPSLAAQGAAAAASAAGRPALTRGLPAELRQRLAFAKQKLQLIAQVAAAAAAGGAAAAGAGAALSGKASEGGVNAIPADWFRRAEAFAVRRPKQVRCGRGAVRYR